MRQEEIEQIAKKSAEEVTEENDKDKDPCSCILSMKQWMEEDTSGFCNIAGPDIPEEPGIIVSANGEVCRPCLLPPLIQWYMEELREKGFDNFADEIKTVVEGGDPLLMAEKFDEVKEKVPDNVKQRLREFDCYAQTYKYEEDESEEQQQ